MIPEFYCSNSRGLKVRTRILFQNIAAGVLSLGLSAYAFGDGVERNVERTFEPIRSGESYAGESRNVFASDETMETYGALLQFTMDHIQPSDLKIMVATPGDFSISTMEDVTQTLRHFFSEFREPKGNEFITKQEYYLWNSPALKMTREGTAQTIMQGLNIDYATIGLQNYGPFQNKNRALIILPKNLTNAEKFQRGISVLHPKYLKPLSLSPKEISLGYVAHEVAGHAAHNCLKAANENLKFDQDALAQKIYCEGFSDSAMARIFKTAAQEGFVPSDHLINIWHSYRAISSFLISENLDFPVTNNTEIHITNTIFQRDKIAFQAQRTAEDLNHAVFIPRIINNVADVLVGQYLSKNKNVTAEQVSQHAREGYDVRSRLDLLQYHTAAMHVLLENGALDYITNHYLAGKNREIGQDLLKDYFRGIKEQGSYALKTPALKHHIKFFADEFESAEYVDLILGQYLQPVSLAKPAIDDLFSLTQ